MKVGLNATCFNNRPSGAKQRFIGIYSELIKRMPNTEFLIYEPLDCNFGSWFERETNVSYKTTPIPSQGQVKKFFAGLGYWKPTLEREGLDLFEGYNLPFFKAPNAKTIMTIHDVRGFHLEYSGLQKSFFKKILSQSLKKVDHVITVSQTIKEEILGYHPESKISVVNNGIDIKLFERLTDHDLSSVKKKFNLPQKFILAVGHFEIRKNYLRLINAFNKLHIRGLDYSLILIGSDNGQKKEIENKIESLKLSGYIKILVGLNDFEVRCTYKLSSLFVFPSTYEGFGIPILESMAADCPFVLSDIPVFKEITENKCIYFNPHDDESIALEIENVLTKTVERERLISYGKRRVRDFSFQKMASQLEYLYKLVMK